MERETNLREALVTYLERTGILSSPVVASAMRAVPRHRFIPSASLGEAYADRAIAIKMRGDEIVSSISQPGMIAQMLELLAPQPGDHVLEIGTGSGYNAALLADIVGPAGSVTTVDLDAELVDRARTALQALGYRNVAAFAADGAQVLAHDGTETACTTQYDRVVVTARTDDIVAAWWSVLREGARLVAPLRLEGAGEYAVGFVRVGERLRSVGVSPCAFIALRGEAATPREGDVFYRDSSQRSSAACVRRVTDITAIRREDATPALLDEADIVIARPVTLFAVRFA